MTILLMVAGALLPTFLLSRVFLWVLRSWDGGWTRLAVAHLFSWLAVSLVAGFALAEGDVFLVDATMIGLAPQVLWFAFDAVRHLKEAAQGGVDAPTP